jgi:hypothetical protein
MCHVPCVLRPSLISLTFPSVNSIEKMFCVTTVHSHLPFAFLTHKAQETLDMLLTMCVLDVNLPSGPKKIFKPFP